MKTKYSNREIVRSHLLGVPLNEEEKNQLKQMAKIQGLTQAGFARMIIMKEIEKGKKIKQDATH